MTTSHARAATQLWTSVLDDIERTLEQADAALRGIRTEGDETLTSAAWSAPAVPAPLPDALVPRAQRLLARQSEIAARITHQLEANRGQLRVADRIAHATTRPTVPTYVDVTA